jgi:hypothetical protein
MSHSNHASHARTVRHVFVSCVVIGAVALACSESTTAPDLSGTFFGTATTMAGGSGRAYVTLDAAGHPTELGLALSEAAFTGLPATPAEFVFALPNEATETVFEHAVINWEPNGHGPTPYLVPHFDFHFYMITPEQREAITAADPQFATKLALKPVEQLIPSGYTAGTGAARMGLHWRDPSSPELNGQPFTATFIYGSYDGRITFAEPMIAKSLLDSKPASVSKPVKLPQQYSTSGYHATSYSIVYDAATKEYRIALTGLVERAASITVSP